MRNDVKFYFMATQQSDLNKSLSLNSLINYDFTRTRMWIEIFVSILFFHLDSFESDLSEKHVLSIRKVIEINESEAERSKLTFWVIISNFFRRNNSVDVETNA